MKTIGYLTKQPSYKIPLMQNGNYAEGNLNGYGKKFSGESLVPVLQGRLILEDIYNYSSTFFKFKDENGAKYHSSMDHGMDIIRQSTKGVSDELLFVIVKRGQTILTMIYDEKEHGTFERN